MNKLDELENRSIYIIREAYSHFEKIAVLWSMGKDSTVLLALCRKAFPGVIPFPIIFRQKEEICLSYIRSVDQSKPWPTKSQHFKLGNAYINLETVVSHYCGMFYNKNSRFEPNHSLDLIETLNAVPEDSDEHHLAEIEFGSHYRGMMIAEQLFNDHPTGRFKPLVRPSFAEARERLLYMTGIDVIDTDFQVQITG